MSLSKFYIHTKRLSLTPLEISEAELFHSINTALFVRKYLWDDEIISQEKSAAILQQNEQHFERDQFGLWKIIRQEDDQILGYTGLWYFFDDSQPQLIYALREQYTGKGYAHEAAGAIIQYAFEHLDFQYIRAATDEPHLASQKTAEKLGLRMVERKKANEKITIFYSKDRPAN